MNPAAPDKIAPPAETPPARPRFRFRLRGPRAGGRYTRFVRWMRVTLPVIAGVVVLLVVIWPQLGEETARFRLMDASTVNLREGGDQQAVNASFTGVDRTNRPYTLIADSATQSQKNPDLVALAFPKADITLKDGAWIALSADKGSYQRTSRMLDLSGDVTLFHDSGFQMRTVAARIDFNTSVATGDRPVAGQGPSGTLSAKGFRVFEDGKRIWFDGPSRAVFWPNDRQGAQ